VGAWGETERAPAIVIETKFLLSYHASRIIMDISVEKWSRRIKKATEGRSCGDGRRKAKCVRDIVIQ
jgi:hypothetical protein